MCGIAGIYNFHSDHNIDEHRIIKMTNALEHRGPDESGFFLRDNVGLGHRRLSIIDVVSGIQPMTFENLVIIYNGEIYNYLDIKRELSGAGYNFKTASDTEVILKAYHFWGEKCFDRFNGEWALAIYDLLQNRLILSRDRYGIKPLYYFLSNESLYFASEIKGLTAVESFTADIDSTWDLLVYGPKPGGSTHLQGVKEFYPGKFMVFEKSFQVTKTYYSLRDSFSHRTSLNEDAIEQIITDSVKKRLISEVPLCSINSGGLDSSMITALALQLSTTKLSTFNVAPELENGKEVPGDESIFASLLAEKMDVNHYTIRYSRENFIDRIQSTLFANDWVMYHSNTVALDIMFQSIKIKYKTTVALGGEGADEVFRGYSSNRILNLYLYARKVGFTDQKLKQYFLPRFVNVRKITNEISRFSFPTLLAITRNSHCRKKIIDQLLGIEGKMSEERLQYILMMEELPEENRLTYYEQKFYLSGLLHRVDHLSMKWGVEARVPFLDHRLVDLLNSIAQSDKCGIIERHQKKILKHIAKPLLPTEIIRRKKYGFSTPISTYAEVLKNSISGFNVDNSLMSKLSEHESFIVFQFLQL